MLPLTIFITIPVLAVAFLSGRFTAKCAAQRSRSERAWFLRGLCSFRSSLFRGWPWDSCQESKAALVGGFFHSGTSSRSA